MTKVVEEIQASGLFKGDPNDESSSKISLEALDTLPYLHQVFKEILRFGILCIYSSHQRSCCPCTPTNYQQQGIQLCYHLTRRNSKLEVAEFLLIL